MIRPLIILSLLCFTVLSCEKTRMPDTPELDEYGLPVYSETGSNTVAFLLNGEPWVNGRKGGITFSPKALIYESNNQLAIGAFSKRGVDEIKDYFYIEGFLNMANMDLVISNNLKPYYLYQSGLQCIGEYEYRITDSNYVRISFIDEKEKIISGEFEYKLFFVDDSKCQDSIEITQGRFDLKYEIVY